MFKIYWSSFSENQLDNIYDFYHETANYVIANHVVSEIIKSTVLLKSNPFLGPIEILLEDRNYTYRYLLNKHFKIIYTVDESNQTIYIVHVFDTRQNPSKLEII